MPTQDHRKSILTRRHSILGFSSKKCPWVFEEPDSDQHCHYFVKLFFVKTPTVSPPSKFLYHPDDRARRGFALVVTLILMMLLAVLALGMLSLSTVAIWSFSQSNPMLEAKANARLGLMITLGQLQEYAGADQRITATADLAGDGSGRRLANGASPENRLSIDDVSNGLSVVRPGTRYWTGVWGNGNASAPIVGNRNIYEKTPSPKLLGWLVSGNEGGSFETSTDPASFGQVLNAGTNINFTEVNAVSKQRGPCPGMSTSGSRPALNSFTLFHAKAPGETQRQLR